MVPTEHQLVEVPVRGGEVTADPASGLAKIALVNRHGSEGKQVALGFVSGLGLTGERSRSPPRATPITC